MRLFASILITTALATIAVASPLQLTGTTTGIFAAAGTNSYKNLTFTGGAFNITTVKGDASLNLGMFALTSPVTTEIRENNIFTLTTTFSGPTGLAPITVLADFFFSVDGDHDDVMLPKVGATSHSFTNENGSGSFAYRIVSDEWGQNYGEKGKPVEFFFDPGEAIMANITKGKFTAAPPSQTPEPGTMATIAAGLIGLGWSFRRKKFSA